MTDLEHSICLVMGKELSKSDLSNWFCTVKNTAPVGVITTVKDDGKNACLIKRSVDNKHHYCVPLTRCLTDTEVERIIEKFSQEFDGDFEIYSSGNESYELSCDVAVSDDHITTLCKEWAKKKHKDWMKDKLNSGWRYGATLSMSEKTHPLLRPWVDLPEKYQEVDYDQPKELLKLLNDSGYVVISKEELDKYFK